MREEIKELATEGREQWDPVLAKLNELVRAVNQLIKAPAPRPNNVVGAGGPYNG